MDTDPPLPWQPISTAPRDGTKILTFSPANKRAVWEKNREDRMVVNWAVNGVWWKSSSEAPPTYWILLTPPTGEMK